MHTLKALPKIGLLVAGLAIALEGSAQPQLPGAIEGSWEGVVDYQGEPLSLRVYADGDRGLRVDYPQLVFTDQEVGVSHQDGKTLLSLPMLGDFPVQVGEQAISGARTLESGTVISIQLTPAAGFHKRTEDLAFGTDGSVAGTLTLPPGQGPFPLTILLAGAGNPNRGNVSYRSWADHLARIGVASLAYDRRPDNEYAADGFLYDLDDHVADVVSAMDLLEQHPLIDREQIYLHAKSRGGWIALETAARDPRIAAIVGIGIVAGSMPMQDLQAVQDRMRRDGRDANEIDAALAYTRLYFETAENPALWPSLRSAAKEAGAAAWAEYVRIPEQPGDLEWFSAHLDTDVTDLVPGIQAPMFLAWGSEDAIAPASMNLPMFHWLLSEESAEQSRLKVYAGASHTLEGPLNVDDDPETVWAGMNPQFLAEVTAWIEGLSASE
ncbi:MAG: alpha/beta hydrolase [Xanthomonadales bacterium]|nr:alpha/beta hydrolase [Xanthomonadales bacterium]